MEIQRESGIKISTALLISTIKEVAAKGEAQEVVFYSMGDDKHFVSNEDALSILQAKLDAGIKFIETGE